MPEKSVQLSKREFSHLHDLIAASYTVESPTGFADLLTGLKQLVEFEYVACGLVHLHSLDFRIGHSSYPMEFLQGYLGEGLATEPSLSRLRTTQVGLATSVDRPYQDRGEVEDVKRRAGIRSCLSFAVRGELGISTYLAFSNFQARDQARLLAVVRQMGAQLHQGCVRTTAPWGQIASELTALRLSPCEEDVLFWALEGKTNWEIGQILNTSVRAVRFHYGKFVV